MLFAAQNITKNFGGIKALDDVNMEIMAGEIVALIGPNGAGKTTFFNIISGVHHPTSGSMNFYKEERGRHEGRHIGLPLQVQGLRPSQITRTGIARTFQNIRLFGNMTVLENILVAKWCRERHDVFSSLLRTKRFRQRERMTQAESLEFLRIVGLVDARGELAKNLSYGDQRRLEIARALATNPVLLLLDEPAAGMNPVESKRLMHLLEEIRQMGKTIFLIEHDMNVVMGLADRVVVLDCGVKIADGVPQVVQNDPRVIEAYLGDSG